MMMLPGGLLLALVLLSELVGLVALAPGLYGLSYAGLKKDSRPVTLSGTLRVP